MKLRIKSYEHYLESHNEWLERIPENWNEKRVKDLFRLVTNTAPNNNKFELLSLYASIGVMPRKDLEARGNKASSTDGYWLVKKGDIVVNKLLAWMGAVGISNYEGVTSPAYDILRKYDSNIDVRYFSYLFRTGKAQEIFKKYSRGIMDMRLRLYFDKFGAITVPVPSFLTQQTIADYLDQKTTQIDSKIELLTQKAARYEELKKNLINETVTRGLNKTAPMKDSGVERIGEVPTHWEVKRLKDVSYLNPSKIEIGNKGALNCTFAPMEKLKTGSLVSDLTVPISKISGSYTYFRENDILVAKVTPCFENRNIAIAINLENGIGFGSSEINVLRPKKHTHNKWLFYFFLSSQFIESGASRMAGAGGLKRVPNNFWEAYEFASPPFPEQTAIADYLDKKTAQIDSVIETIHTQIDKLKELRKTLINDVVTGKIKVVQEEQAA